MNLSLVFIVFFVTVGVYSFFMYAYAWKQRPYTNIRLDLRQIGARVMRIEKRIKTDRTTEWKVTYKDRNEKVKETYCRWSRDQLIWDPPLS